MANKNRNFMDEMYGLLTEIERLKPEPEICNVRCPPFGCPQGPCPGMCCPDGVCDPCCISKIPDCPPQSQPPRSCILPSSSSPKPISTKPQTNNPCQNSNSPHPATISSQETNLTCQHSSTCVHHHLSHVPTTNNNNSSYR